MHEIQALIGSDTTTAAITRTWSEARRGELNSGFFIVPLQPAFIRQATGGEWRLPDLEDAAGADTLAAVVAPLVQALRSSEISGTLALVFTQYWGGLGNQAALLVPNGSAHAEPIIGAGAINQVLARLGVRVVPGRDEFDTIGLDRWRSTESLWQDAG